MSVLLKTTTVIDLYHDRQRLYGRDNDSSAIVSLQLDRDYFEQLGKPSRITVTVEPGDALNDERAVS